MVWNQPRHTCNPAELPRTATCHSCEAHQTASGGALGINKRGRKTYWHHLYESPDCSFLPDCFTGTATLVRQTQMLRNFTNRHFANPAYDSLRTCPAFGGWVLPPASTNANQPPRTWHASNHNQCVRVWWKTMENWALTQAKCAKCMANSCTKQICWLWGGLPIQVLPQTAP